jgi:hypothetical protein
LSPSVTADGGLGLLTREGCVVKVLIVVVVVVVVQQ